MKHLRYIKKTGDIKDISTPTVISDTINGKIIYLNNNETSYTINDNNSLLYDLVDLGLPSKKKWMKYNISTNSLEDEQKYYQWGSLDGYPIDKSLEDLGTDYFFYWDTHPFNGGKEDYDKDEFINSSAVDSNNILKLKYDVVYKITNGYCRIPTSDEYQELINNTSNEWVTNYNNSNLDGILFKSTETGNSNELFFPGIGLAAGKFVFTSGSNIYWSSTFNDIDTGYASYLEFTSKLSPQISTGGICIGTEIRGILC